MCKLLLPKNIDLRMFYKIEYTEIDYTVIKKVRIFVSVVILYY